MGRKVILVTYLLFNFIFACPHAFSMNTGQAMVDKANGVKGKPYVEGNPPNEDICNGGDFKLPG